MRRSSDRILLTTHDNLATVERPYMDTLYAKSSIHDGSEVVVILS